MEEDRIDTSSASNGPASNAPAHGAEDWPLRPWLLGGLLGLAGLCIHFVTNLDSFDHPWWEEPLRVAAAAFLFFGPLCAAFSLERPRWKEVAVFAVLAGLVMAGLAWRAASQGTQYSDEQYGFAAAVLATLLALPLFQAGFHRTRFSTSYAKTHFFVWTDAVGAAGALAFVGLSWALLAVLSELFQLLKIDFLHDLMNREWFGWTFSGATFGAALGTLRNRLGILGTLQSVVLLVLSLLAVPLAVALVIFLLAVMTSGLDVLWEATRSATPVLLTCAAGAFVLTNAIIREDETDMTRSTVMRVAAVILALGILPLTMFAAVSMGTRVNQYGLTPERLWALVAIAVACAYGLAALVAIIRGRLKGWRGHLRSANFNLAVGVSALALFLALPILDFGGISAANQIARLHGGKVSAQDFDYAALRWDFGRAGERALARLAAGEDAEVAKLAKEAREQEGKLSRYARPDQPDMTARFSVYPQGASLPESLKDAIDEEGWICSGEVLCRVYLMEDGLTAAVLSDGCAQPEMSIERQVDPDIFCSIDTAAFVRVENEWKRAINNPPKPAMSASEEREALLRERRAINNGDVTIGPAQSRQIYIDGKPVGEPFQ